MCVRACVRACVVRACVRACVVRACVRVASFIHTYLLAYCMVSYQFIMKKVYIIVHFGIRVCVCVCVPVVIDCLFNRIST